MSKSFWMMIRISYWIQKKYTPYLGVMKMPFSTFIYKKIRDIIRYSQVLSYILRFVRYCKYTGLLVLPYILGYSQIFTDILRYQQKFSDILIFSSLSDIARYHWIFTGIVGYIHVLPNTLRYHQLFSESVRYWLIFWYL